MRLYLRSILMSLAILMTASAQQPKLKPLSEVKPPAELLPGVWVESKPSGDEYMTFHASGRLIMTRGHHEKMECLWKCDSATKPWKLDITIKGKEGDGTIFTVFDFPEKGQFRFAVPAIDLEKRPGTDALQKSTLLLKHIPLEKNEGLFQVVEAHLKGLNGTWQGITSGATNTATFSTDGTYTIGEGSDMDKGRFRIDVSKTPCKIDMLSTEGAGPRYGLYEVTGDTIKFSNAGRTPGKRPANFDGAVEFVKKK